jgi:membrane dipeptidase
VSARPTAEPVATDARRVHDEAIVIDATCPLMNDPAYIEWWIEGGTTAAAATVGGYEASGPTLRSLGRWLRLIDQDPRLRLVTSAADIEAAKRDGVLGIIFHLQGTYPLDNDLNFVSIYQRLGVRMVQLAYNVRNLVGDGCEERTDCSLSAFGVRLIDRLNEERIVVDCTHTGYRTTMDAIARSSAPVVFSHSNAKALRDSRRNITDEQIRAAAATGGLIGIVGFPAFVSDAPRPTLDEFIDHIDYVANLAGIDHAGLGIDYFTGQAGVADDAAAERIYRAAIEEGLWRPESYPPPPYHYPSGIDTPRSLPRLTARLLERGYGEGDVKKVLGGNWLRVFRAVWGE